MSGATLAAIIGGLVLLMIVVVVIAVLKGGFTKVTTITTTTEEAAEPVVRKPSEVAPPASLKTAIAIAMNELRVLVGGGRGPIDVPWALALGVGGDKLAALLPPPLDLVHEVGWLDDQKMARVGTVSFREGGVVLGFDDGLVGQAQAERRLGDLLAAVEGVRPDRPIDSLLVAIPWSLLAGADDAEIAGHGRRLYELLLIVQQRTGWRVPVYLLITETEQVPGFAAVSRAVLAHTASPAIGWPAPKALDTLFDPSWIDDAFDAMRAALSAEQLHLLMGLDDLAAEEEVLLLPERLAAIKPALKGLLAQMLESSAYHEGFMLRGIFLTGDTAPPAAAPAEGAEPLPPAPQPLARILFRDKIFPEARLAQPAYGERTRRHRLVRRTQWALVAAIVLFAIGLAAIPFQANNRIPPIYALLLNILKIEESGKAERDASGNCIQRAAANDQNLVESEAFNTNRRVSVSLLERMSELDLNRIETALAPTSFLTGANWKIESAIKRSFHDVVFTAISESMTTPAGIRELVTRNTPENDFEGYWKATVENSVAYDHHYRLLRDMQDKSIHDAGLLRGFAEIVQYALGEELPPAFKRNYRVYSEGISEYPVPCLYSSIVSRTLNYQLESRYLKATELIYRDNPLVRAWDSASLRFPQKDEADPEPALRELANEIDIIDKELTNPRRYAWIYAPSPGDLPMPRTDALLKLEGPDRDVVQRLPVANLPIAIGQMDRLRAATLFDVPLLFEDTGPTAKAILAKPVPPGSMAAPTQPSTPSADPGLPALTKGIKDTRDYLRSLFGQPFMAAVDPTTTYYTGPRPGWEFHKLQIAQEAVKSYTEFVGSGSGEMPHQLREVALDTAEHHFTAHIQHLVNEAAQPLSAVVNPALAAEGEAANFAQALPLLTNIRNALRDAGATDAANQLDARVSAQAAQLLVDADRDLAGGAFYAVHADSLRRWDGTGSLAAAAFGVNSVDDLKGTLPDRRLNVAAIARSRAAPAVAYLRDPATIASATSMARANRWQSILKTLESYDASAPNTSLAELEQFMTVDLEKLQWRDCARLRVPTARARDYFSEQRSAIARQIVARCRSVATETADAQFAHMRQAFNDTLAGRFPFAAQASAPGANPEDVQAFFLEYGDVLQPLKTAIDQNLGDFDESGRAVSATLDRLIRVRAVLAPMLDAGQARLAYGVGVEFFPAHPLALGQAQVIGASIGTPDSQAVDNGAASFTWFNGDPVTTQLRWAANAPTLPVTPNGSCAPQPGGNIVTFANDGDWALLRLLRERGPEPRLGATAPGIPIVFEVDLCENRARASGGDPVRAAARIFLRLTLSQTIKVPDKPDKQQPVVLPPFPERIPALVRSGRGG